MTLKDLTEAAGIERVIWIDDLFDPPSEINIELRALVAHAKARKLTVTLADHVLTPDKSVDEWLAEIEEACEEEMTVDDALAHLRKRLSEGTAAPIPDYNESAIAEIMGSFGAGMVTKAGASDWKKIKTDLSDAKRTLVVVDREFYVKGVASPLGEDILKDVVKAQLPSVHVVMLTRSVDEDTEALRTELANRLDIPFQDFVVAAKTVSEEEGQAESRLCSSFQILFTHQVCIDLTRSIYEVAKGTLETTVEALSSQSVYDLDRVVFQNSLTEGASELDVLTRMLLLRQRVEVDSKLGSSEEYFDLLAKLRSLRALAGPLTSTNKHGNRAMLEQWRRDEVIDPGTRVNEAHSPLACGDVFVLSDSSEVFVLLGQTCDMAVRQNGFRNTHEAIFAKAEKWNPEQARQNGIIGSAHHFFPIPALPIAGNDHQWRLDLRTWSSVNLRLLDFSVFSGTGEVRLDLSVEPPVFLLPGWRKMLERAKKKITAQEGQGLPAEYAELSLSKGLKKKAASRNGDLVVLSYARVGRLRAPWAVAAYAAFASYQTRAAFDHDFAKGVSQ